MLEVSSKEGWFRMSNSKQQWPFKKISQKSSWPMQGIVVNLAAAVLQAPKTHRVEAAEKMIERCFRMGARLALEFGVNPVKALKIAQRQIEREIPGAKAVLVDAKMDEAAKIEEMADAIVSGQISKLFTNKPEDKGKA